MEDQILASDQLIFDSIFAPQCVSIFGITHFTDQAKLFNIAKECVMNKKTALWAAGGGVAGFFIGESVSKNSTIANVLGVTGLLIGMYHGYSDCMRAHIDQITRIRELATSCKTLAD